MALTKVLTGGVADDAVDNTKLDLASNYAFTGTVTGAGHIVQSIFASTSSEVSTSSSSHTDTGLSGTITPTSASNKILITVFQNGVYKDGGAASGMQLRLLRGSTTISTLAQRAGGDNGSSSSYGIVATQSIGTVGVSFLDTPNTTSATTYKTTFNSQSNAASTYCQVYSCDSTIVLQEIAT